jgi:uncharacterized membrane protein YfcA
MTVALMAVFAFCAGFVDSVVGGGGLIQMPALLIFFPNLPIPSVVGTNKIASFTGTAIASVKYARNIKIDFLFVFWVSLVTLIAALFGAKLLVALDVEASRSFILVLLIFIAVYTFTKRDLGNIESVQNISDKKRWLLGICIGVIIGFYDGIFGPGTGSLLTFCFVILLGQSFLVASANSRVINCFSNLGGLIYLLPKGLYILELAIIMAIFNGLGAYLGSKFALKYGVKFVRLFFLIVVTLMICRYSYDVFILRR